MHLYFATIFLHLEHLIIVYLPQLGQENFTEPPSFTTLVLHEMHLSPLIACMIGSAAFSSAFTSLISSFFLVMLSRIRGGFINFTAHLLILCSSLVGNFAKFLT